MNKMKKHKELSKRLDKIEKHLGLNTEVSVVENELTELPENWFIIIKKENQETIKNWFDNIGNCYTIGAKYGILDGKKESILSGVFGGKEITFDQFKKWVLKDNEKATAKERNLSIREVQVKVTSQEEANECAEIAKACGENIWKYKKAIDFSWNGNRYFRINNSDADFGLFCFWDNLKEISIQEYRERFGKSKEIDWSKPGQLVTNDYGCVWRITGSHTTVEFEGVCVRLPEKMAPGDNTKIFKEYSDVEKYGFRLCTEPITLKNE